MGSARGDLIRVVEADRDVVGLTVRGYSDKLTAYHLGIAEGTVSRHLSQAMSKLGIHGRVELVRRLGRFYPRDEV